MPTISLNDLQNNLQNMDQTVLATVRTVTEPDMRKTNNPFYGKVFKVQDLSATVGSWSYSKAVNTRRQKEWLKALLTDENTPKPEEFVPKARRWGQRVPNTPFVEHKGQYYVELSVHDCLRQKFVDDQGKEVSKALLEPWLTEKGEEGARQGLEKPVTLRDVKIENIVSINYAGQIVQVAERSSYGPSQMAI